MPKSDEDAGQSRRSLSPSRTLSSGGLDTADPAAGGGRGFSYEWEKTAASLEQRIVDVEQTVGPANGRFTFTQGVASATWTIAHNLGAFPEVVIIDGSGQELNAEIRYTDSNNITVVHSAPYSGVAYLRS